MEKQDARKYLISKGYKLPAKGRFTKEQVQVLKESGLTFTRPIKDGTRKAKTTVPLA